MALTLGDLNLDDILQLAGNNKTSGFGADIIDLALGTQGSPLTNALTGVLETVAQPRETTLSGISGLHPLAQLTAAKELTPSPFESGIRGAASGLLSGIRTKNKKLLAKEIKEGIEAEEISPTIKIDANGNLVIGLQKVDKTSELTEKIKAFANLVGTQKDIAQIGEIQQKPKREFINRQIEVLKDLQDSLVTQLKKTPRGDLRKALLERLDATRNKLEQFLQAVSDNPVQKAKQEGIPEGMIMPAKEVKQEIINQYKERYGKEPTGEKISEISIKNFGRDVIKETQKGGFSRIITNLEKQKEELKRGKAKPRDILQQLFFGTIGIPSET